jgi:hypothetical protein
VLKGFEQRTRTLIGLCAASGKTTAHLTWIKNRSWTEEEIGGANRTMSPDVVRPPIPESSTVTPCSSVGRHV